MEATPRPIIVPIEYTIGCDDNVQSNPIFKWSQRDRALMRLYRTIPVQTTGCVAQI
jgi:hypothetical protein